MHSPGPWEWVEMGGTPDGTVGVLMDGKSQQVLHLGSDLMYDQVGGMAPEYDDQNLIKAAPDLLEALKEIAKGQGAYDPDGYAHARNTIDDMKALAKEAIEKAEVK